MNKYGRIHKKESYMLSNFRLKRNKFELLSVIFNIPQCSLLFKSERLFAEEYFNSMLYRKLMIINPILLLASFLIVAYADVRLPV
ncbi:uncharacterized protein BDZ99DRAFT_198839 [Mytilinidion resinicola]|uniref:Uncharacterized protein n=1 Tax=Mytilinidion resinicola TaxID=574789 RepID=A0A6A6Y220_9PEZI|nr:uncharacterized protein BDZ99DRAFT_198839 [Mytilinidion resinicola]KAF2802689.1 hypothetical protein BDZ99DRAFT_198839 [Mytilinidion resinicola]